MHIISNLGFCVHIVLLDGYKHLTTRKYKKNTIGLFQKIEQPH